MTARTHLVRAGLSLSVTGLAAAVLSTGTAGTPALGISNDLSMQRLAFSRLLAPATDVPPTAVSTPATGDLTFTLSQKSSKGVPSLVAPGYHKVTVVQHGKAPRDVSILRLKGSYTIDKLEKDLKTGGGDDSAALKAFVRVVKGVESVGGSGTEASSVVPTTHGATPKVASILRLSPGSYVLSNTDEDGNAHNLFTAFTVTSGAAVGHKPSVAGTFSPYEYGFSTPSHLRAGKHMYAFKNAGQQAHIDELLTVPAGATADDVLKAVESDSPPAGYGDEGDLSGIITKGATVYRNLTFKKGTYALICFLPEQSKKNGEFHFMEGMIKVFTVS